MSKLLTRTFRFLPASNRQLYGPRVHEGSQGECIERQVPDFWSSLQTLHNQFSGLTDRYVLRLAEPQSWFEHGCDIEQSTDLSCADTTTNLVKLVTCRLPLRHRE